MVDVINIIGLIFIMISVFGLLYYTFILPDQIQKRCGTSCDNAGMNFSSTESLDNETRCWCELENLTIQV